MDRPKKDRYITLFKRTAGKAKTVKKQALSLYESSERFHPVIFFAAGFLWDSLTLTRIDRLMDNLVLLAYLLLLGAFIIMTKMTVAGATQRPFIIRFAQWYPMGIQFFLGGLLSSYVVFYFQSASMTSTSLFLVLLAFLLIANEFLHERLNNFLFQISLYYLVGHSFFIFFIPVILKTMNYWTFAASGLLSAAITGIIVLFLLWRGGIKSKHRAISAGVVITTIFLILNVFYVMNWIPPVPLSLKSGGIYRNVVQENGSYALTYAKPPWYKFWQKGEWEYLWQKGDKVYCFTAIFAPTDLKKKIFHHWMKKDPKKNRWKETDRLGFRITGGRAIGWRGFTSKQNLEPGVWRVEVRTDNGLMLGEVTFLVRETDEPVTRLKTFRY